MSPCNSFCLTSCLVAFLLVSISGQSHIGKGRWLVENVSKCPNPEQYKYDMALKRKKLNRTHDGFDMSIDLPQEITQDNMGIRLEACKKVDGGCKLVQIVEDDSLCNFVMKYAAENFNRVLNMAGLEEGCPVPKGHHVVRDYVFDYTELPEDGMLGNFQCTVYMTRDGEKFMCVIIDVVFEAINQYATWE